MPITLAPTGQELHIRKVRAEEKIKRHLQALGLTEGSAVTLLSSAGGNVILCVKEGRLCLDKTLAAKISVG